MRENKVIAMNEKQKFMMLRNSMKGNVDDNW